MNEHLTHPLIESCSGRVQLIGISGHSEKTLGARSSSLVDKVDQGGLNPQQLKEILQTTDTRSDEHNENRM